MMASNGVDSYKRFFSAQKVKLSVLYPFLSQEQIKGKIKKRWQALKAEDKSINKTPVKHISPKCQKGLNSSTKRSQMKIDNCVSNTPEFINTHKLQDFRKRHGKTYKNDFLSSTGASQNSRSEMEHSQEPGEDTWTFDGTSSGNGSCSDDDAVLIKRNFDADGNIVNDDEEVEQNTGTDDHLVANPDIESENGELVDKPEPKEGETNLPDMKGQEEINNNKLEDKKSFQNVNTEDNVDISTKMTRTKRKRLSPQKNVECKKVKSLSLRRRRGSLHTSVEQEGIDYNVSDDDVTSMNDDKENMVKKTSRKQKQVLSSETDSNENSPCNSKSCKQPNKNLDALKSNHNKRHDKHSLKTEKQIDAEEHYNHTMDQDGNNNKCVTDDETVKESTKHRSSKKSKQNMAEIDKVGDKDKAKNSNELHTIEDMKPSGDASTAAEKSKRTLSVKGDKQKQNEDVHQTTDEEDDNLYDSDDTTPQTMSGKSDEMAVKKPQRTNSTLERILSNLRSTGMQSSSSGCEPSSSSQDSSLSHVSNNMVTGYELNIEEMFSDVASPTKNDRGQFKTTRMVTKSAHTDPQSMHKQFQQLFDEDSDFI